MPVYSLWLVPERDGPAFAALAELIRDLARQFDTPVFDPHVTLVGGLEGDEAALAAAAKDVAGIERPQIELTEIVSRDSYFQRLVVAAAPTPPLLRAHALARAALGAETAAYWPHLSLAYGELDAAQIRRLLVIATAAGPVGAHFPAAALELWRTDGAVSGWACTASFPLPPGRAR